MFSVIIPLYNKEISISSTIQSVLSQTFADFEVIIVNDGSTDSSQQVISSFVDSRIKVINKKNEGVSTARNTGTNEAKFNWIVFLDGDDLWKPNHLHTLFDLIIEYPKDKIFCTSFVKSDEISAENSTDVSIIIEDYFTEAINFQFFWTSVACIHKSVFLNVGLFNTKLHRGEDLDLWARIGRKYRFIKSNRITAVYKIDAENRSNSMDFDIQKSFLSVVNLKEQGMGVSEYNYKKHVLKRNLKRFIVEKNTIGLFYVVLKLLKF